MKLTVILATCKPRDLRTTLKSLANCTFPSNFSKTIIIENGTLEPSLAEVISDFQAKLNISYLHCREGNKSAALNLAIQTLDENQLLFLTDDDVQYGEDILVNYCRAAEGLESGYVFGGEIIADRDFPMPTELTPYIPSSMKGYPPSKTNFDPIQLPFIGSNWAVFSDDVKRLGGFDPRFGPGSKLKASGQETQMIRTMSKAGFKLILVENATVRHKVEPEHYGVPFVAVRHYRGGVESGVRARLAATAQTSFLPRTKSLAKAILYTLASPIAYIIAPRTTYYKLLFGSYRARGCTKAWFCRIPEKQS